MTWVTIYTNDDDDNDKFILVFVCVSSRNATYHTHIFTSQRNISIYKLTFPLKTMRAAANSDCGTLPLSMPNVFATLDNGDGTERPWAFSARTKKTYDVAGLSSPI